MALSDDQLLEFDDPGQERARDLLAEHGDLFRSHLVIALGLSQQAEAARTRGADVGAHPQFVEALLATAFDLRDGQWLPGEARYRQTH